MLVWQQGSLRVTGLMRAACAAQEALERASLVPGCLRALAACTLCALGGEPPPRQLGHADWQALAAALLRQPSAPLLLDALCDAVRTLYRMVRHPRGLIRLLPLVRGRARTPALRGTAHMHVSVRLWEVSCLCVCMTELRGMGGGPVPAKDWAEQDCVHGGSCAFWTCACAALVWLPLRSMVGAAPQFARRGGHLSPVIRIVPAGVRERRADSRGCSSQACAHRCGWRSGRA